MQDSLLKIADIFNQHNVTWALGASMLLHYKGLVSKPNDIDIIVSLDDVELADTLLNGIGVKRPDNPDKHYKTKHFLEYVIDDIDVDIMAGFIINYNGHSYEYELSPETFENIYIENVLINLCPIEDWYVLYSLMPNRQAKIDIIQHYLKNKECRTERLEDWLDKELPVSTKIHIGVLLNEIELRKNLQRNI